jgi:hypothetical protein
MSEGGDTKLAEYQAIIRNILSSFNNIPFYTVVESAVGRKIVPYDGDNAGDQQLVKEIGQVADALVAKHRTNGITELVYKQVMHRSPKNFRNNEAAVVVESEVEPTFKSLLPSLDCINKFEHLPGQGYPDTRITTKDDKTTYVEIKATTRPNEGSPRDFYFTPLKSARGKIRASGHHFLLGFILREDSSKSFITTGWKLIDLYRIRVSMKPEFNCNNLELYRTDTLILESA